MNWKNAVGNGEVNKGKLKGTTWKEKRNNYYKTINDVHVITKKSYRKFANTDY